MSPHIDFSPLKNYSLIFKVYIWVKRIRMIALRLLIAGFFVWVGYNILSGNDRSYHSEGTINVDLILLLIIWFGLNYALLMWMNGHWRRFAEINKFTISSDIQQLTVPSFRGKRLRVSLPAIKGTYEDHPFGFFTRMYKEGGIIRWRERKMDTILCITLPKSVPHIVIDSRFNERARRSNLSKRYKKDQLLHFEGSTGDKYFVYAAKGNAVAALQLFTPDVLEVLFARLPEVDIEVRGSTLWFVWRYAVLDEKVAADLFSAVSMFMNEFSHQLETTGFSQAEIDVELV